MRWTERALTRPNHCAVWQTSGQAPEGGFIDPGVLLPGFDNQVYISIVALGEMCRFMDWPTPESQAELTAERDGLLARVEELEAELLTERRVNDAIDVLESKDFRARKKAGRPKTKKPPEEVGANV